MKRRFKEIAIILSELVFVLGGGILVMRVAAWISKLLFPRLRENSFDGVSLFLFSFFVIVGLWTGMLLGVTLWIYALRRFLTRDEIKKCVTDPHVPLLSTMLERLFEVVDRR